MMLPGIHGNQDSVEESEGFEQPTGGSRAERLSSDGSLARFLNKEAEP